MAKGSGPISYNELFNNDVDAKLAELSSIVNNLDSEFQGLASTIAAMSGKISVNIKTTNTVLEKMATDMGAVDVATRGAADKLHGFSKELDDATKKGRNLKDQQAGLNATFDIATASVDEIKARVKQLTAEYTSLGRVTDADKAKMSGLAKEVVTLKNQQETLTTALNKTKTAIVAADGSYTQMSQRLVALKKELLALPNAFNPATGALNKANTAAVALHKEINILDTSLKKADAAMGMHGRNVGNYKSALGGALESVLSLALSYVSLQAAIGLITQSFGANLDLAAIKSSLSFTLGSVDLANEKLDQLRGTAERLGLSFTPLAETYSKFAGAAKASNFPLEQADKIFNSVAGAAARFNLTSDQLSGALLSLQQMISKGTVQSEELRGQLGERLPGAFSIAARAMGKTEKELGKLLETGQVTANDLLPKLADELDKTFSLDASTRIDNLTASTNKFKSSFDAILQGDGISRFFKLIVDGATGALTVVDKLFANINRQSGFFNKFGALFKNPLTADALNNIQEGYKGAKNQQAALYERNSIAPIESLSPESLKTLMGDYSKAYKQAYEAFEDFRARIGIGQLANDNKNKNQLAEYDRLQKELALGLKTVSTQYDKVAKNIVKVNSEITDSQLTSIAEIRKRISELQKLPNSADQNGEIYKRIEALRARLKDADKERERAEKEREAARKKAIKDADDLIKAQTKLAIAERERQEISDLSTATEEEKTPIIIKFEKDKLAIIEKGITERQKLYKKGTVDYIELETEKAKASGDSEEEINKATKDALDRRLALQEKYENLRNRLLDSQGHGAMAAAEFAVTSKVYKGNPQEQEAQKQDALYNLRKEALKKDLSLVELRNANIKDATERELTIQKEKQDIINQLNQLGYDDFVRLQDQQKTKIEEMFSYLRDNNGIIAQFYGQEFGNLFDSLTTNLQHLLEGTGVTIEDWANTIKAGVGAATEAFRQGSEERIAALEAEKQSQMDIAGQNATARANIEKEFNAKIRAEKIKQAKIDKAAAIFDIIINTAVAASKVTAQTGLFGLPLVPLIIAFGALQAGLVAARPLPAFRKGTQNAPEGFARVGEEGAELIENRRGQMRIAHSDQVTYLERGDKVYTAEQTRKILDTNQIDANTELHGRLSTNLHQGSSERRVKEMSIAFSQNPKAIGEEVGRRIKDLPIHQTYFTEQGVSRYIQHRNTRTKYLNDRTSLS